VLLYLWAPNPTGTSFVEQLAGQYEHGGFTPPLANMWGSNNITGKSWWGLEQKGLELPEDRPERALVVRGLAASKFVMGEVGTHLFCPDNSGLVPVQVHAWPLGEGEEPLKVLARHQELRREWLAALARGEAEVSADPLGLQPVVRIVDHKGRGFDLRSGRMYEGLPFVGELVQSSLPWPEEVT
jgi:hypothetical protein